jgi:hypothetical protein
MGPDTRLGRGHQRMWESESPRHAGTTAGGHADDLPRQEP